MILKQVVLTNIQCHKKTTLNLSKQLQIIRNVENSGKTAIFRGLKWILFNIGSYDSLLNYNSEYCSVLIEDYNGNIIERYRSSDINRYIINGKTIDKVGRNIPNELDKLYNIKLLDPNNCIINQTDSLYLLSKSEDQLCTTIDSLSNLKILREVNKDLSSDIKKLQFSNAKDNDTIKKLSDFTYDEDYINKLEQELKETLELEKQIKIQSDRDYLVYGLSLAEKRLEDLVIEKYRLEKEIQQSQIDIDNYYNNLKICPTCGQEII
jgi:hypothetical protein